MEQQVLYRIGEASAHLGLHDKNSNTLRSWVEEFKEFLGASANPEAGRPRFFTEEDMRVLRTVRDLRTNHLPYSEIKDRLTQGTHAVEQRAVGKDEERQELLPARDSALTVADQIQSLLAPMTRAAEEWQQLAEQYRTRLAEREERVLTLEQRIDGLQARLEDLYATAITRQDRQVESPARKRRWWMMF
jgi:DNA-binding transcriptional MerR regulator